jgi:HPt (histidine-containing phosphotransfer) domain-containing protein
MTTMIPQPVDAATYIDLQDIMADEFTELVEFFLTDTQQCLIILQQCITTQDSEQVGAICHKLKSSCKLIGAFALAEFAHLLEDYRENNDQAAATKHLSQLQAEFARVIEWINQHTAAA